MVPEIPVLFEPDQFMAQGLEQIKFDGFGRGQIFPGVPEFDEKLLDLVFEQIAVRTQL
jgi:hypothetical protein